MELTEEQKQQVAAWLSEGLKLADVQKRMESDFGLHPTYMEVKLLVSDLRVMPKDTDSEPAAESSALGGQPAAAPPSAPGEILNSPTDPAPVGGQVSVTVDQMVQPGALVSGTVTFSDDKQGNWYLDQTGRLGLAPREQGYRPSEADMQQFRAALESEMSKSNY